MKVVVTTGAIRGAKIRSHCQQSNTQLFTDQMPFLSPNQQCQSTEGKTIVTLWMIKLTVSVCWFVGGSSLTGALHGLYIAPAVTTACIGLSYSEVEHGDVLYWLTWVDLENSQKMTVVVGVVICFLSITRSVTNVVLAQLKRTDLQEKVNNKLVLWPLIQDKLGQLLQIHK